MSTLLAHPFAALLGALMGAPRLKRRAFKGYVPSVHDVFVCTYAKSGTNWAMQIAYQVSTHGQGEFGHIHDVVPWPEGPRSGSARLSDPPPSPTGLRVIKTHLESPYLPYRPEAKYIVVLRDPAEVLVSAYFFWNGLAPAFAQFSPEAWYRLFLRDALPFGSWAEHTASYWPWRGRDNVLFLSYSEMKADLSGTVGRVAELMQVPLTAEARAQVAHKSTFAYMKGMDKRFAPPLPPLMRRLGGGRAVMMRRGERGAASELLSAAQQQRVRQAAREALRQRGADFPFDELFPVDAR